MRNMLAQSREAVMVVDASDLTLQDINLNACQMIGYLPEELIGKELSTVECSLLDVFFWDELVIDPAIEGSRVAETEWMRSDGTSFQVEKRVSSFEEDGHHFWIIYADDLTRRKELEQQQLQLVAQLQSSLESTAEGILAVNLFGHIVNLNRRFSMMWTIPDQTLRDIQSQPGTTLTSRIAVICLRKFFKYPIPKFDGDTATLVFNFNPKHGVLFHDPDINTATLFRKLGSIGQQIRKHLQQPIAVPCYPGLLRMLSKMKCHV